MTAAPPTAFIPFQKRPYSFRDFLSFTAILFRKILLDPMELSSKRLDQAVSVTHLLLATLLLPSCEAIHHMKRAPIAYVARRADTRPLNVVNQCAEPIWAAFATQAGTGPSSGGFKLDVGQSMNQHVSPDWQGRVWGRTNCSFNAAGTGAAGSNGWGACTTGDCAGLLGCKSGVSLTLYMRNKR